MLPREIRLETNGGKRRYVRVDENRAGFHVADGVSSCRLENETWTGAYRRRRRRGEVSDLTRGNLVFSSLNSKRSRVSLGLGTSGGGRGRL